MVQPTSSPAGATITSALLPWGAPYPLPPDRAASWRYAARIGRTFPHRLGEMPQPCGCTCGKLGKTWRCRTGAPRSRSGPCGGPGNCYSGQAVTFTSYDRESESFGFAPGVASLGLRGSPAQDGVQQDTGRPDGQYHMGRGAGHDVSEGEIRVDGREREGEIRDQHRAAGAHLPSGSP